MKDLLPRFAYALLGILVFAAVLLTLGQRESQANPSASSYNPSGLHALVELLEENGIKTQITRLQQPHLEPNDLVVATYIEKGWSPFSQPALETIEDALKAHLKRGGNVLVLPFDADFRGSSRQAISTPVDIVNRVTQQHLKVHYVPVIHDNTFASYDEDEQAASPSLFSSEVGEMSFSAWTPALNDYAFASFAKSGDGTIARLASGIFATNRFIDRADDAEFSLRLIQGLLPKGGRVIFAEASMGHGIEPSLVSILGPWATGMWVQLMVLFVVLVFTLGVRFGLPEVSFRSQRGQREMVDAISYVFRRAKSPAVALDAAYESADARVRRAYKLPSGLEDAERDAAIPPDLALSLRTLDQARRPQVVTNKKGVQRLVYDITQDRARELIVRVERQLQAYLPSSRNRIS